MTQQDYEKARQQCWNAAALNNRLDDSEENKERFFDFIFDNAYALGMKAANKQQWTNVDRQLPETDSGVLVFGPAQPISGLEDRYEVAYYDGEDWHTTAGKHIRPDYWMNIPPLNYEKEER